MPPAGCEPALTAPEAGPVHGCYLAKRAQACPLRSVWGGAQWAAGVGTGAPWCFPGDCQHGWGGRQAAVPRDTAVRVVVLNAPRSGRSARTWRPRSPPRWPDHGRHVTIVHSVAAGVKSGRPGRRKCARPESAPEGLLQHRRQHLEGLATVAIARRSRSSGGLAQPAVLL